jgi:hypothetical protein
MATTFIYKCPNTGLNVQGFVADDPDDDRSYQPVACIACRDVHLVNPRTGKLVGEDDSK